MRIIYMALGWLMVGTGIAGVFLPVLPTTPFLLVALWCFTRSSPRLERWLLEHPRFGKPLKDWRQKGAIARRAKVAALTLMTISYAIFWFMTDPPPIRASIVAAVMCCSAAYVATRPDA